MISCCSNINHTSTPQMGEKICCAKGISSPSRGGATKWRWGFNPLRQNQLSEFLLFNNPPRSRFAGQALRPLPPRGEKICCAIGISSPSRGGATKWRWGFNPLRQNQLSEFLLFNNPPRPSATPPRGGRNSINESNFSPPPGEMSHSDRGGSDKKKDLHLQVPFF